MHQYIKLIVIGLVFFLGCKTQEEPTVANYYNPVFDQTRKVNLKTQKPSSKLDTTVLIRSNLRDTIALYWDTITMEEVFFIEEGELAVPLELINEKPPKYDTLLVASEFLYTRDLVDALFPVIPDSILLAMNQPTDSIVSDSVVVEIEEKVDSIENLIAPVVEPTIDQKKQKRKNFMPAIFMSKEKRQAARSRRKIDKNMQFSVETKEEQVQNLQDSIRRVEERQTAILDSLNQLALDSIQRIKDEAPLREIYSKQDILNDTLRDLLDVELVLDDLVTEVPWLLGDSIPYFAECPNYYLDSSIVLKFDTVLVEVFVAENVVPQLPLDSLSKESGDTLYEEHKMYFFDEVQVWLYHEDEDDVYIEMVRVQGGRFKMGSDFFDDDERPAYSLQVSNFLLSKYEVTNKLFCYFLNDLNCDSAGYVEGHRVINLFHPETKIRLNPWTREFEAFDGFDEYPVVNVTWIGSQLFCKTGGGRLPSEAEWEYAAKGGVYAKRFFIDREHKDYDYENRFAGGNYMNAVGWFVDNSRGQLWVGGRKKPNELGLYDMSGNVWEWCYDKYSKDFYRRNHQSRDPMNVTGPNVRTNRGGSWSNDAMYCRVTNRNFLSQYAENPYLGFRYMREWK